MSNPKGKQLKKLIEKEQFERFEASGEPSLEEQLEQHMTLESTPHPDKDCREDFGWTVCPTCNYLQTDHRNARHYRGCSWKAKERELKEAIKQEQTSHFTKDKPGLRSMRLDLGGQQVYASWFDPKKGNLLRMVEDDLTWEASQALRDQFHWRGWNSSAPSPSPETVDIGITNVCNHGCPYCYRNSSEKQQHGPTDLVERILLGFHNTPYQVALGGGEPTLHPEFVHILKTCHEVGTVPNYTTNGTNLTPSIVRATNELCGGVALTYHRHKGWEWFEEIYKKFQSALDCQLNVHLLVDRYVMEGIENLRRLQQQTKKRMNVVLLAYSPDTGRASMDRLITRSQYTRELPNAIKLAIRDGMNIAFSEGMLPYFLSRPEIGVETRFATRAGGLYSCYFDHLGRIFPSSFQVTEPWEPDDDDSDHTEKSVFNTGSQELWEKLMSYREPSAAPCFDCPDQSRCNVMGFHSYAMCSKAPHNSLPLVDRHTEPGGKAFNYQATQTSRLPMKGS